MYNHVYESIVGIGTELFPFNSRSWMECWSLFCKLKWTWMELSSFLTKWMWTQCKFSVPFLNFAIRGLYDKNGLISSMDIFEEEYFYAISYLYFFLIFKNLSTCLRNYNLTWRFQKYSLKYFILRIILNR